MADWNASQYLKFEHERTRPARDLLAQVPLAEAGFVVDLGCGPGNSTELVAARFPAAEVLGLDTSPAMLIAARERVPQARFEQAEASVFTLKRPADLIFANAVLQWVPDHGSLLPRLLGMLAPGGVLAVQMPDNLDEPSHVAMRETAMMGPWADKLVRAVGARAVLPTPQAYYDMLVGAAARVDIWHTIYNHPLEDVAGIVEWVKATGLRPFLDPLEGDERVQFLEEYRQRLADSYPIQADGKVLLAFPRLFIVAQRKG